MQYGIKKMYIYIRYWRISITAFKTKFMVNYSWCKSFKWKIIFLCLTINTYTDKEDIMMCETFFSMQQFMLEVITTAS